MSARIMHPYTAYGLGILSTLTLPELLPHDAAADVVIRCGSLDRPLPDPGDEPVYVRATPDEVLFHFRDIGWIAVRSGTEIVVEPLPAVDERALRLFILGPALGVLLHQRGDLVLHGSTVSIGGGAVGFLGQPGQGKSTMAAALHARGHPVVGDDVVDLRFEGSLPLVIPGFPQLKLSAEAAGAVGHEADQAAVQPFEKQYWSSGDSYARNSLPPRRLYIVEDGDRNEILPLSPQEALLELIRHSYVVLLLGPTGTSITHFEQCTALARRVPVCRLTRRRVLGELPDVAGLIEEDIVRASDRDRIVAP